MTAWRWFGCRPRRRRKQITAWKAWPTRNAGIWSLSICWNGPGFRCLARTSRNETRISAWGQDSRPLRNLKPRFQLYYSSSAEPCLADSNPPNEYSKKAGTYTGAGTCVLCSIIAGCAGCKCVSAYNIRYVINTNVPKSKGKASEVEFAQGSATQLPMP